MGTLRGKYRFPVEEDLRVGTSSAVLTQALVAESLRREQRRDDGLNAFRGAVNAILISLVFWIGLGFALFGFF